MKRLVNLRFSLFSAIGVVFGILCAYQMMYGKYLLSIVFASIAVVATVLLALCKSKLWLPLLLVTVFAVVGCGVFHLNLAKMQRDEVVAKQVTLSGRVTDIGRNGERSNVLYLDDCLCDGKKIAGRVYVVVYDGSTFDTGDKVVFDGVLRSAYLYANEVNTSYLRNNVHFTLTNVTLVHQGEGNLKIDEVIRKYIYDVCQSNMFRYPGLTYALLTGDRNAMEPTVEDIYKDAGLLHLVAVSGMHLVYIITIFGFVLNRFRLHPLVEFAILIVPLAFYTYVCAWAPSIVRALLMTVCVYLARWLFGRYDIVTSLSWSVLVLLLVNPNYLFDVGWQLSVLSVLGIGTLHFKIDRILQRKKLSKFVYSLLASVSISLSCTLATLPTMAHYFGEAPILGVFSNLVAVPLMSWAFTLALAGLLPWVFHYLLHPADGILAVVTVIARAVASWDIAVVSLSALAVAIAVGIIWLFVAGDYVNLKGRGYVVANVACALAMALSILLSGVRTDIQSKVYVAPNFDGVDVVATHQSGDIAILSNLQDIYSQKDVVRFATKQRYDSCTLYVTEFASCDGEILLETVKLLGIDKVYVLDYTANDLALQLLNDNGVTVVFATKNAQLGNGVLVRSVYDGYLRGVVITTDQITVSAIFDNEIHAQQYDKLIFGADVYLVDEATEYFHGKNMVTFSLYQDYYDTNYGANKYGNFTILQKDDTIIVNFQ